MSTEIQHSNSAPEVYNLKSMESVQQFSHTLKSFVTKGNLTTNIRGKEYANVEAWQFSGMAFGLRHRITEVEKISGDGDRLFVYYHDTTRTYKGQAQTREVPYLIQVIKGDIEKKRIKRGWFKKETIELAIPKFGPNHKRQIIKPYFAYKAKCEVINQDGVVVSTAEAICSNMEEAKIDFDEYAVNSMAQTRVIGKAYRLILGFVFKVSDWRPLRLKRCHEIQTGTLLKRLVIGTGKG